METLALASFLKRGSLLTKADSLFFKTAAFLRLPAPSPTPSDVTLSFSCSPNRLRPSRIAFPSLPVEAMQ